MLLWCLCCTFLKWQDRRHVRTRDEVDGRPLLPTSPSLRPQPQHRRLRTLAVLLNWVIVTISSIWYYVYDICMIMYVSIWITWYYMYLLQLGRLVFFHSASHYVCLHETQKSRHKASQDIIANSLNHFKSLKHLSKKKKKKKHISHIHHFQYCWSLTYHYLPLLSTSFIIFRCFSRLHPCSLSGSSDLPILPAPRPGMAFGAMLSVTFPGDKWGQDVTLHGIIASNLLSGWFHVNSCEFHLGTVICLLL